jgi:hypothetical protein
MTWQQILQQYPKRWLLLEAIKVHSDKDKRVIEDFGFSIRLRILNRRCALTSSFIPKCLSESCTFCIQSEKR